jgi:Mg2+-importing ATPase
MILGRLGRSKAMTWESGSALGQLRASAVLSPDDVLALMSTRRTGISTRQAQERLDEYGENVITVGVRNTWLLRLAKSVVNPFNSILLLVAAVTYFTDIVASAKPDWITVGIILTLVFLSSLVAFIQAERSNAAVEGLTRMVSNTADVWRDGTLIEIPFQEVVPGDIVRLSAGDMLPADVRFLTTKDTFISQSVLTGESDPVEKASEVPEKPSGTLTDLPTIGFLGTDVVSGSATAVVLATGTQTYFGAMAKTLSGDRAKTSFERGIGSVSWLLIRMMLVTVPVVFLINGLAKDDWGTAFLFALSVAVGLTPEMLPVIMTSTLAKGAVTMSRHKVIVRTLGAIQTFGEMDVLCTDKTGTLTEDRIVLEKYMNVTGEDDERILRYAYLNSHFQTGLKNLIDLAIIDRAESEGLSAVGGEYTCIDEIPFDFSRRRMSVVVVGPTGRRQLIMKGAVEEMLEISTFVELDGQVLPMDDQTRRLALETFQRYDTEGLRMLAVARKIDVPGTGAFGVADENQMTLIGFVGFLDPPKDSAKAAIAALQRDGVRTKVLTGDSGGVAALVCNRVGIDTTVLLTGADVDEMDDGELAKAIQVCDVFAKLSPTQKERLVEALQVAGHTVGYLGDGINDAPALRRADVGISVDNAVDIAKETADIVLLQKDLMVLEAGVIEGRRTFGNILKYIKMAASGNVGNIISVMVASLVLPFLPMLPLQILTQNLLTDFSQLGLPFDNVDAEYLASPRRWETASIKRFIIYLGPLSSVFDLLCFAVLWWVMGADNLAMAPLFQGGWFVFGTLSQVLVVHLIRTQKIPFVQSRPATVLMLSTLVVTLVGVAVAFSGLGVWIGMVPLPLSFVPWLALLLTGYFLATLGMKQIYIKREGEWL